MYTKTISRPLFLIVVALIGLFCWAVGIIWFTERIQPKSNETTAVIRGKTWNVYTYRDKKVLSFDYPKSWEVETEKGVDGTPMIILSFKQNGKLYHMTINNSHTKEYRGEGYFSVDETRSYGNKQVLVKTLYHQNKPTEIVAVFTKFNPENDIVQTVNLELPPKGTAFYFSIFDHVMTSLNYE